MHRVQARLPVNFASRSLKFQMQKNRRASRSYCHRSGETLRREHDRESGGNNITESYTSAECALYPETVSTGVSIPYRNALALSLSASHATPEQSTSSLYQDVETIALWPTASLNTIHPTRPTNIR